jgi:hypothetical protein
MSSLPAEARPMTVHVAKYIVENNAPEELELFDELTEEYFADPTPPDRSKTSDDDPLAFGAEGLIAAATPAALAMVSAAVTYIGGEVLKATQEEAAGFLVNEVKKRFNPRSPDVALNKAQLNHVYLSAVQEGIAYGMEKSQAEMMARSLAGTLVLRSS